MRTRPAVDLLWHLRGAFLKRELSDATDAQLLTRYLLHREESAFAAIMRRHGAMVLGVCRRILSDSHDAEDAFQATFLVLVRKAATIVPRERLGSWLHGVAQRTALKARTTRARWTARGRHAMAPSPAAGEADVWLDLQPILDQELATLAECYRLPIVLCDLEGKSRKEAAGQLGWKEGTLSGRLSRGRRLLAARLVRRGVILSTGGLAALLTAHAQAAPLPAELLLSTSKAALLAAAGDAASLAGPVATLAQEVLNSMLIQKLKTLSLVLVTALLGMGVLLGFRPAWGSGGPEVEPPRAENKGTPPGQERPAPAPAGMVYLHRDAELKTYDLQRKQFTTLPRLDAAHRRNYQALTARLSPDGRFLAFGQAELGHPPSQLQIRDLTGKEEPRVLVNMPEKELSGWNWSPDGRQLSFAVWEEADKHYHPYVVDVATQQKHPVTLPALEGNGPEGYGALIQAWSPDGLWLVFGRGCFHLVDPTTRRVRRVTPSPIGIFADTCRFSPDGKKVLFVGVRKDKEYSLSVLDLLLGKTTVLADLTGKWEFAACWSPDGRRVACSGIQVDRNYRPIAPCHIEVYDAEGEGRPQRLIEEEDGGLTLTDWR